MLETIHDMLTEIKKNGIKEIEPYLDIGHNPTIGDMYEGLTRELMNKIIFKGLNLKVVSGKIRNNAGIYTKQIDCMIVIGEGMDIPFTDKKVYEIKDVIAVIEVKKNLFSKEIEDSYDNLKSVVDINGADRRMSTNMVRSAFKSICVEELPLEKEEILKLSEEKQLIYHSLIMECYHPARIVFGYNGFVSEYTLREKFLEFINENAIVQKKKGYSPVSLPSLIICGNSSLIKTNGIPYALGMKTTDAWMFYGSYNKNPILLLLEVIWTRLTFQFKINSNELFEGYLNEELIRPLLIGQPKNMKWEYIAHHISQQELIKMSEEKEWEPVEISVCENVIFMKLCANCPVYINDAEFIEFLETQGEDIIEIITHLMKYRLIYVKDNEIKLLTEELKVVCVKGDFYAAETKDNRFSDWLRKNI